MNRHHLKTLLSISALFILFINTAIAQDKPWSVRMVESEMVRNPQASYIDHMNGALKWNYTTGLELQAFLDVYDRYGDRRLWDYALQYADTIINDKGEIYKYKKESFNLDHVCPGRMLFRFYDRTGEKKYRRTIERLREQLRDQPRTTDGGFWHKQVYPWQMWLDGLYMGEPFYAEYAMRYEKGDQRKKSFEDIAHQFITVAKHTLDPESGLYRHAWDESREMFWSDNVTGQSKHVWGRALGWYTMALVETLDYLPKDTKGRDEMIEILQGIYRQLPKFADPVTGMWYQVLEQPEREGNYQESTGSAMFAYALLKGVRKGYLDRSLQQYAIDTYQNFLKTFVIENADGTISITNCCAVAGLGGKDNRDGTFDYYISEPIRNDDAKGVGAFIWASLEWEILNNIDYVPETVDHSRIAFPGAEGGGMYASGGRGGRTIYVTKLDDDGSEGTLRHAVEQKGPRTIVFAVSGNISLKKALNIENGDLTIAGQTAPGDGICIKDEEVFITGDNIIIRYLRFRLGENIGREDDAVGGRGGNNIIIDHCSASWSTDECASFYANSNFTMQWCIVSESLNSSTHSKGNHGYGGIWGGRNASFHHNLLIHNNSRNPRLDHSALYRSGRDVTRRGTVDYVNNVIYNWGSMPTYGGEEGWWNVVNNYYKPGPASRRPNEVFMEISTSSITSAYPGKYYVSGNVLEGSEQITADNWKGVIYKGGFTREDVDNRQPFQIRGTLAIDTAEEAYEKVLAHAGASLKRDVIDLRLINEVRKGTYTYTGSKTGMKGIIDTPSDVGGWPELRSTPPLLDSDGDGIPDVWETANGLDPQDSSDANLHTLDPYFTNLEIYLNSLVKY